MSPRTLIVGSGGYLPSRVVSNDLLARSVATSDEWIRTRTGITQRHLAAEGELTSDLGIAAARAALSDAGMEAKEIDLIIVATTTPDRTFPATAVRVQHALGLSGCPAFDIQAVCTGFLYGLSVADKFIAQGECRSALVIGAETLSRILDWEDRETCVLFGDGAGALLLRRGEDSQAQTPPGGMIATRLHADGEGYESLYADGGPSLGRHVGYVRMKGRDIYRQAVSRLVAVSQEVLAVAGMDMAAIDWFVPHQANWRIMEATASRLGLVSEKVISTIADHANTSAASIPLALHEYHQSGRLQKGDLILLAAIGGGLTWGASLLRW